MHGAVSELLAGDGTQFINWLKLTERLRVGLFVARFFKARAYVSAEYFSNFEIPLNLRRDSNLPGL